MELYHMLVKQGAINPYHMLDRAFMSLYTYFNTTWLRFTDDNGCLVSSCGAFAANEGAL